MYDISYEHKTCERKPINLPFPPMAIPPAAVFEKQFVLGSLSEPGKGLLLNVWSGTDPQVTGELCSTSNQLRHTKPRQRLNVSSHQCMRVLHGLPILYTVSAMTLLKYAYLSQLGIQVTF